MDTSRRLLITGASGFLGRRLCRLARTAGPVAAVVHSGRYPGATCAEDGLHPIDVIPADLTAPTALADILDRFQPDAVINAAALADPNACQKDPDLSRRVNLEAAARLAGLCAQRGLPLAHVSTDMIFDGRSAPYADAAPASPVSVYGRDKALAEDAVLEAHPDAVVCRLPLMFGLSTPPDRNFFRTMLEAMRAGREVRLFTDEFRTPIDGEWAARGILWALDRQVRGRLNLGGPERVSRYDFGLRLAQADGLNSAALPFLIPIIQADLKLAAPRPPDVSLNSGLAASLGFAQPGLDAQLAASLAGLD